MTQTSSYDASAERRLMVAVLEDAVRTLLAARRLSIRPKWIRSEYEWIKSTDQRDPFAFESICDVLGIDPGAVRRRVLSKVGLPPLTSRMERRRSMVASGRRCSASS
ncbi:MAG: hypothetical protein ACREQL_02050 [Candidatus Binatia bacterium]